MGIWEKFSLRGKNAVVTGGASGMGRSAAEAFAELGANVALLDLNLAGAEACAQQLCAFNVDALAIHTDVTDEKSVEAAFETVYKRWGRIDVLFNNVGISFNSPAETMSPDDYRRIIEIDLIAPFLVAQTAGKYMIEQQSGSIINTASMSGHIVNIPQCQCGYNSAKAGVIQLTKSLAVEWAKYNIRVNCISPGYMDTPMTAHAPEERRTIWRSMTPMKRMGTAPEIQGAVAYLASDAASFTTGCDIRIDGGFTCI